MTKKEAKYPDDRYCDKDISMDDDFTILEPTFECNLFK